MRAEMTAGRFRRTTMISILLITLIEVSSARAETVSTLTLDWLSFVSFGDVEDVYLPAGSTIQFRFGDPYPDGSIPFTIQPQDVAIGPAQLPSGAGTLTYSIPAPASGLMQPTSSGRAIAFNARVRATLSGTPQDGSFEYTMPFTTEVANATNIPQTVQLTIEGMRLIEGVWFVQLVAGTTNKEHAFPQPGTAVYTMLSGSFDTIP